MQKEKRIIYYQDELNDEFSGEKVAPKVIDGKYKYVSKNPFFNFLSFFMYHIVAMPIAALYKLFKGVKIANKKVLKDYKKSGYFVYANHTSQFGDVFVPHTISFPIKTYTVVASENLNLPGIWGVTRTLGALPIPGDTESTKNFFRALQIRSGTGNPILIYPEAHIWPYYTGIRPFKSTSFRYPIKFNKPTFCYTTTYQKGKGKKPKIVVYVDGPFFPDKALDKKTQQENLRNQVFDCMLRRSQNSNFEVIKYIKKEKNDD